jgi:hypothetical protein
LYAEAARRSRVVHAPEGGGSGKWGSVCGLGGFYLTPFFRRAVGVSPLV